MWSVVVLATIAVVAVFATRSSPRAAPLSFAPPIRAVLADVVVQPSLPRHPWVPPPRCPAEPALELPNTEIPSDKDLTRIFREAPNRLGSASIGTPTNGALYNGVPIVSGEGIASAGDSPFGTAAVVASIKRAVREVRRCHAGTSKLSVGDISSQQGGPLRPHKSHQSGLDADIGYYYRTGSAWFVPATPENLDVERTWTLLRAFVEGGNVEIVFMDRSIQKLLVAYVDTLPYDRDKVEALFQNEKNELAVIRHAEGHATHFHVRFQDPGAVLLGARIKDLVKHAKSSGPTKGRGSKPAPSRPAYPRVVGPH